MKRLLSLLTALAMSGCLVCIRAQAVSARAAVVIDAQTGEIVYSLDSSRKLPMASTTKIMTTLLLLESGELDSKFVIDERALLTEGSSMNLCLGDEVTKRELCYGMMLPSGNDAANASALKLAGEYEAFAEKMNSRARKIGMKNTNFVTPSGLHDANHYSTAYDMALLTREALKNEDFREVCCTKSIVLSSENWSCDKYLTNTNKLLKKYPGCIGVKTGFTDEAGRCLVSAAEKEGVTLICVTLHDPDDWNDHTELLNDGFGLVEKVPIENASADFEVNVAGGTADTIKCKPESTPYISSVRGKIPETAERIFLPEFVYAPVKAGDRVGYAEYLLDGEAVFRTEIIAAEDSDYVIGEPENPLAEFLEELREKIIGGLKNIFMEKERM